MIGPLMVWFLAAGLVHSGPWPREAGQTFLSLSGERDRSGNAYTGLYAEYGLTGRRTFGAEVNRTTVGETGVMIWYQKSLDDGEGAYRLSYSMGFGAIHRDGALLPQSQAALMLGRGFSGLWGGGWLTAEARIKVAGEPRQIIQRDGLSQTEAAYLTPQMIGKLDLTAGIRPTPDWAIINQLRLESRQDSDFQAKLASSIVYDIVGPARLEAGVVTPLAGPGEAALKLGTWFDF